MPKTVTLDQNILDRAIQRAVEDLARQSGQTGEAILQMAQTGVPFIPALNSPLARQRARELNRGLKMLREAMSGIPRQDWARWYTDSEN